VAAHRIGALSRDASYRQHDRPTPPVEEISFRATRQLINLSTYQHINWQSLSAEMLPFVNRTDPALRGGD